MNQFSWKRIFKIVGTVVLACGIIAGIYFFVTSGSVRIAWVSLVYDRRENFLNCEDFPFYPQVQKVFAQHPDAVNKIKAVPGVAGFFPEENRCRIYEGGMQFIKGQAVLEYQNRSARAQAEKIIGKDFFGIPYRGEQVGR